MPSVCFYFQVHQPYRISRGSLTHFAGTHQYFDEEKNAQVMAKVARKCYLPTNRKILELIRRYNGAFRVSYSITGVAIEQMQQYAPEVLESFQELVATGCVELLGETFYHSLAAMYDEDEFTFQVEAHRALMQKLFGKTPTVFRNTELIYEDRIGRLMGPLGFKAIVAEGWDDTLEWRSPNFVYTVPGTDTRLLLKNYKLSDDIAFRFSNRGWECWPLTADTFASWVHNISGNGETVGLFMDYETFGEHQWESTGIFEFLDHLPEKILCHPDWNFLTPSEVLSRFQPKAELSFKRVTSWADMDRDLSAWLGNNMQQSALSQIFALGPALRAKGDGELLHTWRKLLTSDHFYYMCTKWFADGDVHAYFSPYESPYEAFIYFMNAFKAFQSREREISIQR